MSERMASLPHKVLIELENCYKQVLSDPNLDNEYLRGYGNGIILCAAIVFGREPVFLEPKMTEHQGLPVSGYKPQTDDNVALVNQFKELEERVLRLADKMKNSGTAYDQRLLAIGVTQLQGAFMFINRSVFQPGRISLPEDNQ